ncbi:MAG: Fe-S cluster assembly ATPase SufC [Actinobacteria bacterium 21-64-8]|nr:MAG: Fe-S cluster assembly ATPase SufC [Actinobacteria bacterium 21-64-8]
MINSVSTPVLELQNLHVSAEGSPILRGVDLVVGEGEVHALMGPNGAGKSTLANVVMGHPGYVVTQGTILFRGQDISKWSPDERARAGIFLAFQYPESISGVSVIQFLRQAIAARKGLDELSVLEVRLDLAEWMDRLGMDAAFAERHLNEGFSGGERKRNEVLQMALLEPIVALLDETDSGLDIDALRVVAKGVRTVRSELPTMGVLVVTHYVKLLEEIVPDQVHVLIDGRVVTSGGSEVAERIERDGYDALRPAVA